MPDLSLFVNDLGDPVPALTADEMREVDRLAIEVHGPSLLQMMENAGRNLALSALELLGNRWRDGQLLVLAGTGGNGGGGIAAARHLANRGADVAIVVTNIDGLEEVPTLQLDIFRGTDGRTLGGSELASTEPALVIDAIIGYSLRGSPRGAALDMIEFVNESSAPVVSLDTPSGLDVTSGTCPGAVVTATTTVTLALPKCGLTAPQAGDVVLADIGIPPIVYRSLGLEFTSPVFDHRYRVPLGRA